MTKEMTEDERILAIVEADVALKKAIPFGMTSFYLVEGFWTMEMDPDPVVAWEAPNGEVCQAFLLGTPMNGEDLAILSCCNEEDPERVFNLVVFKDNYQTVEKDIENPVN